MNESVYLALDDVPALFIQFLMAAGPQFDLPYSVEELIALTGDYRVAWAAFDEAVKVQAGADRDAPSKDEAVGRQPEGAAINVTLGRQDVRGALADGGNRWTQKREPLFLSNTSR